MTFRIVAALMVALAALLSPMVTSEPAFAQQNDAGEPERVYFSQTGQHIDGSFLEFWWEYGGVPVFGFPVTGEVQQNGRTVQYFERAVLELHPENPPEWQILLRRLGAHAASQVGESKPAFDRHQKSGVGHYFSETGQNLHYGFLEHWEANGGVRIFGYPISSEFRQGGMTVQYFERAIFEYHPDNPPAWQVLQPLIGAQAARNDGVDMSPKPRDGAPEYHPNLWKDPAQSPGNGDRVVYLTFDDGPNETWTPRVLDVLGAYDAKATFFVIGSRAKQHPGLINEIVRRGHGIGNHTYNHTSLRGLTFNQFAWQVRATANAANGHMSSCLRPPFGRTGPNTYGFASELGYQVTMWDVDPRDWEQPGSQVIVNRVLNNVSSGDVVLMHDGGGSSRAQTVEALRSLLPRLAEQGYEFRALCR